MPCKRQQTRLSSLVGAELNKNVVCAMQVCEEARDNSGYVAMGTDSHEGTPMRALVKLPELKACLHSEDVLDHTIWETAYVPKDKFG